MKEILAFPYSSDTCLFVFLKLATKFSCSLADTAETPSSPLGERACNKNIDIHRWKSHKLFCIGADPS